MKMCKFYESYAKCTNSDNCVRQAVSDKNVCTGDIYKVIDLEQQIKRLKWYLKEIRYEELSSLDIEWDEYETDCIDTDYSNIITLVEEALNEVPEEDCRYRMKYNE